MQHPWITFPPHFSAPTIRSLCLLFILDELALQFPQTIPTEDVSFIEKLLGLKTPLPPNPFILDKLCFYCAILLQTSQVYAKTDSSNCVSTEGKNLHELLETLRLAFLHCRSDIQQSDLVWDKVQKLFLLWREQLIAFFLALIPFLQEARADENVLLSLSEHKEIFDQFMGANFTENLLTSLFPQGDMDWKLVLAEGFQRRHFTEFLHSQKHLMQEI